MTIRERKLILHFLEMLYKEIENRNIQEIDTALLHLLSRKELIDIVIWLYKDVYSKDSLATVENEKLLELINTDSSALAYVIEKWKDSINAVPKLEQSEINEFFDRFQLETHYLRTKPVEHWDSYDVSNYYSILYKRGKTRRVFVIFTSDVKEEDKYVVSTKPSFFFDTREEAQEELERCIAEENFNIGDLKIMSLWKIE